MTAYLLWDASDKEPAGIRSRYAAEQQGDAVDERCRTYLASAYAAVRYGAAVGDASPLLLTMI